MRLKMANSRQQKAARRRMIIGAAIILVLGMGTSNGYGQAMSPTEVLKKRDATLQELVASMDTAEGDAKIRQAIVGSFDFEQHSRISLGKYWKQRSKVEQEEFTGIMRDWTENRAIKKLMKRSDITTYGSEELLGSKALVKTTVRYKGTKTLVDYKMQITGGQWVIYDMVVDGASVALANRDAFYKKIKKTSYEELVSILKAKTLETN
ncbi:MAG: ABC transporter substrate-binding protein [Gemmatimonadota bacterium]|nr:ABC transporter substrate-binding protein [Gemmatimonadota bacterium]